MEGRRGVKVDIVGIDGRVGKKGVWKKEGRKTEGGEECRDGRGWIRGRVLGGMEE